MIELKKENNKELMARYPNNYFDLAIVDPPYFKEYAKQIYPGAAISTTGIKRNRYESKHWDIPDQSYFNELFRISKNQIIWGCNYYAKYFQFIILKYWIFLTSKIIFSTA